ncbi:MAG: acetyl-CoA carboxylase biotin carboxyl carrier protein [Candidatus Competibacterales bacterium]
MDIRKIKRLIELLQESDVTEIEIQEGDESLRISRQQPTKGNGTVAVDFIPSVTAAAVQAPAPVADARVNADASASASPPAQRGQVLKAPMVGTFYRAATPGTAPFVEVGQRIEVGDVVCIIEAMKMFNQIEAECSGVILDVLVENGQPVEYDQPLFVVE